ncbi:MAG TPA: UvrD-helicase domain-containing protein [Candidatus Binataceae bacterium]|nr:UvrD-helicase domain-containing protein [Candidatus Binataceae bacterium]
MKALAYTQPRTVRNLALDRNAIIEASAGTGKTFTIEHLVARLLLETPASIDRILVVTFTEKATGELRSRIRGVLERILRGDEMHPESDAETIELGSAQLELLRRAVVAFDSAPIHTIHSFCRRVLSELAFGTGARFGLELVDGQRAFHEAMRAALRETLAREDEPRGLLETWLEDENRNLIKLEKLLYQAHQARCLEMDLPAVEGEALEPRVVRAFLPQITARLEQMKQERGTLDYADMLSRVRDALRGEVGPALVVAIRARYSHALIDEFQDTDDLQWEIFRRVFVESGGANPIFLIGDPKQSIYSFRGADVHAYVAARRELTHTIGVVPLVKNFRATGRMIEALNLILDQKAPEPFFSSATIDIAYDHPVECGKRELRASTAGNEIVPVVVVRLASDGTSAGKARHALGTFIADEIHALLKDPDRVIEVRDHGVAAKPVSPNEIFVLTRTTRESEEAGRYLRARGVPFAFYKQEGLFQTAEASDVLDVLAGVADPSRRSNRLRAWASPFFAIPFAELPRLLDVDPSHPLNDRLMQWKSLADAERFAELFDALLYASGVADRELLLSDSERELTNYQQIFEILLEQAAAKRLSLAELVELLDDYFHERALPPGSDRNVQRLESERAAVQIMTIHKAKGLEADVVFMFGGSHSGNDNEKQVWIYHQDETRRVAIGKAQKTAAKEPIDREAADEDRRLSYVAITRARLRMYLPFFPEGSLQRKANGYYQHLNRRLAQMGELPIANDREQALIAGVDIGGRVDHDDAAAVPDDNMFTSWRPPPALLEASFDKSASDLSALRGRRAGLRIESYTSLARGVRDVDVEDFKRDSEAEPGIVADDLVGGANVGVFLHEVIEQLDFESFEHSSGFDEWKARAEVRDLIERTMRLRQVLDPRWASRAQEIVFNTLCAPIEFGGQTVANGLRACDESREMEFTFPIPERAHPRFAAPSDGQWRTERGFVTGYVDFVFRQAGRIYFADWKSDLLDSYAPDAVERVVRGRYENQKLIYSIGVVRLLGIRDERDYESRFGGLLYVFLRGIARAGGRQGIYFHRPSWSEVCGYVSELGAKLGATA